jgi:hypothetical protein
MFSVAISHPPCRQPHGGDFSPQNGQRFARAQVGEIETIRKITFSCQKNATTWDRGEYYPKQAID